MYNSDFTTIVQLLLRDGVHIDMRDKDGNQLISSAKRVGIYRDKGHLIILKCLYTMINIKIKYYLQQIFNT